MTIHIANSRPSRAAVLIFYRDHWYYIADNDIDAKQTMTLISLLYTLQAGDIGTIAPVLTIPTR